MFVQTANLSNPQIIPLIKNEFKTDSDNFYIFSEDDFAQKIVREVKITALETMASIKGMTPSQFCTYLSKSVVSSFDAVSIAFANSICKLHEKKIPSKIIATELNITAEEVDEVIKRAKIIELAEQIEDEEITQEIEERAKKYGSIEEMLNTPGISDDEFWAKLDVTGDLDDVEAFEIA